MFISSHSLDNRMSKFESLPRELQLLIWAKVGPLFVGVDFRGKQFRSLNIKGAMFDECILIGADFSGCGTLERVRFKGCDLTNARFVGCSDQRLALDRVELDRCDVSGVVFDHAVLDNVSIRDCVGSGLMMSNTRINQCAVRGGSLTQWSWSRCDMDGTSVSDMIASIAVTDHCNVSNVVFDSVIVTGASTMKDSDFYHVLFSKCDMKEITFQTMLMKECCILDSAMTRSTLEFCDWVDVVIENVDMSRAKILYSEFSGSSVFARVNLSGAAVHNVRFRRSTTFPGHGMVNSGSSTIN